MEFIFQADPSRLSLGAHYQRLCTRMDKGKAVIAPARKLARLIYAMLTKGEQYTDTDQNDFKERYRGRVLGNLADRAKKLGMQITPMAQPA